MRQDMTLCGNKLRNTTLNNKSYFSKKLPPLQKVKKISKCPLCQNFVTHSIHPDLNSPFKARPGIFESIENTVEKKRRNCWLQAFSPFPTMFSRRFPLRDNVERG